MRSAVIFDLFGTLVAGVSSHVQATFVSEAARVIAAPEDAFRREWSNTHDGRTVGAISDFEENVRIISRRVGVSVTRRQVQALRELRDEFFNRSFEPRSGAIPMLERLREQAWRIGMLSNCPAEVPKRWCSSRLGALIDHAVFSCDVGAKKPDSRIYREACFRLQAGPEECVYVADGDGGELHAAEDLGMVAVQVVNEDPRHRVDPEVWHGPKVRDLHELIGLLEVAGRPE